MNVLETLKQLNTQHGPAGDEAAVAQVIRDLAAPYADEITTDTMGNLTVHKKGGGSKVMFAAHMDSLGFVVTHIDQDGFLRVGKIGGIDPAAILNTPVRFKNGIRGKMTADEKRPDKAKIRVDDLVLDIGAADEAGAKASVQIGDTAVYDVPAFQAGTRIVAPYLDDRIGCIALLMALAQVKEHENDLYFVFTVQEELGMRGVKPIAFTIDPDYAVAVDVTPADDVVGASHSGSSCLGQGAAIKVMDNSVICHPEMVQRLEALARENGIRAQRDVIRYGGTDAGVIHVSRGGVITGGISIPCRYTHTPTEMVEESDVTATAQLLAAFAQSKL